MSLPSTSECASPPQLPLSAADLINDQLSTLTELNRQLHQLGNGLGGIIDACVNGGMPVDMLAAVCLLRLRSDVCELARQANQVMHSNRRRWIQVKRRQSEER